MPACLHRLRGLHAISVHEATQQTDYRRLLHVGTLNRCPRESLAHHNAATEVMEHCDGGELLKAEAIRKARFALIACHLAQNPKPVWQVVREGRRQGDALPERWAVKRSDGSSAQANTFASARTHYLLGRIGCWTRKAFSSSIKTCF